MADSSLLPISLGTGEKTFSDSSAQPLGKSESEMKGSEKVENDTHRGMKSRHLTMIGMYSSCSDLSLSVCSFKLSFAQQLVVPSAPGYF